MGREVSFSIFPNPSGHLVANIERPHSEELRELLTDLEELMELEDRESLDSSVFPPLLPPQFLLTWHGSPLPHLPSPLFVLWCLLSLDPILAGKNY